MDIFIKVLFGNYNRKCEKNLLTKRKRYDKIKVLPILAVFYN